MRENLRGNSHCSHGMKKVLSDENEDAACRAQCFPAEEKRATSEGFGFTSGSDCRLKSRSLEWNHNREVRLKGISGFELGGYYRNLDAPHVSCTVKVLAAWNTVNKNMLREGCMKRKPLAFSCISESFWLLWIHGKTTRHCRLKHAVQCLTNISLSSTRAWNSGTYSRGLNVTTGSHDCL